MSILLDGDLKKALTLKLAQRLQLAFVKQEPSKLDPAEAPVITIPKLIAVSVVNQHLIFHVSVRILQIGSMMKEKTVSSIESFTVEVRDL